MMENNLKMTFGRAYSAPEVQVTEVLVEQGFVGSGELEASSSINGLNYAEDDYNDFQ